MTLDADGSWLEEPLPSDPIIDVLPSEAQEGLIDSESVNQAEQDFELVPPQVSDEVLEFVEALPEDFQLPVPDQPGQALENQSPTQQPGLGVDLQESQGQPKVSR
jgi:hypothetical protein